MFAFPVSGAIATIAYFGKDSDAAVGAIGSSGFVFCLTAATNLSPNSLHLAA
jgi:hypothetical protein